MRSGGTAILGLALAFAVACTGGRVDEPPREATPSPPPPPSLVGGWRLVEDVSADSRPLSMSQEIREYTFRADGTFAVRSYHDNREGGWVLRGDALTETAADGTAVTVAVESLARDRLVLVEAVPPILRREASAAERSRNTFRRVDESPLGPLLGSERVTTAPTVGRYAASYAYGSTKFPTMEISERRRIAGGARLELAAGGAASACLAVHESSSTSISRYASHDGEDHHNESDRRLLVGARGSWAAGAGGRARVVLDRLRYGACAVDEATEASSAPIELRCQGLAPTDRLPVPTLACELVHAPHGVDALALNPADSPRAGPYTLQSGPAEHFDYGRGTPWLLLGAAPGLHVECSDDRGRTSPQVTFTAAPVSIDERAFQTAPEP